MESGFDGGRDMTKREIFEKLNKALNNNVYGTCALMGNLQAESGLKSTNLQNSFQNKLGYSDESYTQAVDNGKYVNFARDSAGYGLAQWTYWTRKQYLLNYAKQNGKSIGDCEMQIDFLLWELQTGYKHVFNCLKNAADISTASDVVLKQFERPANQSEAACKYRASLGEAIYNELHTNNEITDEFYKADYEGSSIIDALKSIGVDSSKAFRTKIAKANGIENYTGTAAQNKKMLSLLKAGKLRKI